MHFRISAFSSHAVNLFTTRSYLSAQHPIQFSQSQKAVVTTISAILRLLNRMSFDREVPVNFSANALTIPATEPLQQWLPAQASKMMHLNPRLSSPD